MSLELSLKERLVLAQNYRLLALQDPASKDHWERLEDVVRNGYTGLYWRLTQDFASDDQVVSPEDSKYVNDVLRMFDALEAAITRHSPTLTPDQQRNATWVGFDGNSEGNLVGYAENFSEGGRRYANLMPAGRCPARGVMVRPRYEAMLAEFRKANLNNGVLPAADLIRVLSAY